MLLNSFWCHCWSLPHPECAGLLHNIGSYWLLEREVALPTVLCSISCHAAFRQTVVRHECFEFITQGPLLTKNPRVHSTADAVRLVKGTRDSLHPLTRQERLTTTHRQAEAHIQEHWLNTQLSYTQDPEAFENSLPSPAVHINHYPKLYALKPFVTPCATARLRAAGCWHQRQAMAGSRSMLLRP